MEVVVFIKCRSGVDDKVIHRTSFKVEDLFGNSFDDFVSTCKLLFPKSNLIEFNILMR